jgi:taurine dioxygenase
VAESDSQEMLEHLYRQAENPAYHIRHRWSEGDIAFWDNRITQHAVMGDVVGHRRLERVSIVGDRPF